MVNRCYLCIKEEESVDNFTYPLSKDVDSMEFYFLSFQYKLGDGGINRERLGVLEIEIKKQAKNEGMEGFIFLHHLNSVETNKSNSFL